MKLQGEDGPVVAHIMSELRPGGVEVRTYELLQHLDLRRQRHIVYTMSGRKGPLAEQYEALPVSVVALKMRSLAFPLRFIQALRRQRVSVVHSNIHYSTGYLLALAYLAGVPTRICHFRSDGPKKHAWADRAKAWALKVLINRFATSIVAVSPGALELAWSKDWRLDPRCSVLQNGLDLDAYVDVPSADLAELRGRTLYPIIAHIGRADLPTKNRDKAIGVLAALLKYCPDATLVFVGRDGRDQEQARANRQRWDELAKEKGVTDRVVFAGERDDVRHILRGSHCFLLTSTLEGLPGVLLEALASGLPAVSTDIPGARYINEQVGGVRLVEERQSDDYWARALKLALDERSADGSNGVALREQLRGSSFDMSVSSQRYMAIWNA